MSKVRCQSVSEGLRDSEALVTLQDYKGRRHVIRVERDFLSNENGINYLPIGVVHVCRSPTPPSSARSHWPLPDAGSHHLGEVFARGGRQPWPGPSPLPKSRRIDRA
jgi:hypothetical protein